MRLGIPGSTATVLPDHASWSLANTWAEMVKTTVVSMAGNTAFATVPRLPSSVEPTLIAVEIHPGDDMEST